MVGWGLMALLTQKEVTGLHEYWWAMNSKCVEQRHGKREIRKTGYAVALQVGENSMSVETWSADSIVVGQ